MNTEQKTNKASYFNPMSIFAYMGEEFGDELEILENEVIYLLKNKPHVYRFGSFMEAKRVKNA